MNNECPKSPDGKHQFVSFNSKEEMLKHCIRNAKEINEERINNIVLFISEIQKEYPNRLETSDIISLVILGAHFVVDIPDINTLRPTFGGYPVMTIEELSKSDFPYPPEPDEQ